MLEQRGPEPGPGTVLTPENKHPMGCDAQLAAGGNCPGKMSAGFSNEDLFRGKLLKFVGGFSRWREFLGELSRGMFAVEVNVHRQAHTHTHTDGQLFIS